MTSLAYSSTDSGTTAVITVQTADGNQISLPISSTTGGADEASLFEAIASAITAYRTSKGF